MNTIPLLDDGSANRRKAFTLIELMVVVAVIGILVALLVPAVTSMRISSFQNQCLSNLHSVGTAISMYVNDNDGTLPGPTYWSQSSVPNDSRFLAGYLAPYLGFPNISFQPGKLSKVSSFRCPACTWSEFSYAACQQIKSAPFVNKSPWGDLSASPATAPMKMIALTSSGTPLSKQWALCDRYGTNLPSGAASAGPGRHRQVSVLFFDWHVESQ